MFVLFYNKGKYYFNKRGKIEWFCSSKYNFIGFFVVIVFLILVIFIVILNVFDIDVLLGLVYFFWIECCLLKFIFVFEIIYC